MLDNFTPDDLKRGVELVAGRALVEASGNVNLDTVGRIARTGVDIISVGALTHSVRSLDLGLDVRVALG
jgi:nicotinate-nucleotide pyrophosphorylase (carboxylating)